MTRFAVWAPAAGRVEVEVAGRRHPLRPAPTDPATGGGWWQVELPVPGHGVDYAFRLDGGEALPDPRSRWQPYGVAGPSRTYDHTRFAWSDAGWRARPLAGGSIYELHVGTFTPQGTFDAAITRLDHLVRLGVDFVELMPVASFPGRHGWGYDVVHPWAVHEPYGGPDGLKRFVDAAHARGLAVLVDVVYNHVGPGGEFLARFGPYFNAVTTPWGPAVNLDGPGSDEVRGWIVDNALCWLRDYHLDGLRLDAVHAFEDHQAVHILEQLAVEVDALAAHLGRPLSVIAESDLCEPRLVTPRAAGGYGLTAQWSDDFHHALHAALTGERQGYYADFGDLAALAKTLTRVFFHDGTWSSFRGRHHGRPVDVERTPGYRFLGYLQDHDQVGNRARGDRVSAGLSPELLRVGAGLVLTAPFTPMLFMGEEWGARTPWQFFTDHPDPDVAERVRRGRRAEFARHGWPAEQVPDPQDPATFARSRLDWSEPEREPHRGLLDWYRALIALRRRLPELTDPRLDRVRVDWDEAARWLVVHRGGLRVVAYLADSPVEIPLDTPGSGRLLASDARVELRGRRVYLPGPGFVVVATDSAGTTDTPWQAMRSLDMPAATTPVRPGRVAT